MGNIMINQKCNLHCSYCFADNQVDNQLGTDMSFENFQIAVEAGVQVSGSSRIGIIGGEPTLHPEFVKFVKYAADTGHPVTIFSNGLLWEKYWEIFLQPNVSSLWNINGPEISGPRWADVQRNLEFIYGTKSLGERLKPGINIFSSDMNLDYMIELAREYKFTSVRSSIIVPNRTFTQGEHYLEYMRTMLPKLLELNERLAELGCIATLDCNVPPPCCYTSEDIDQMHRIADKLQIPLGDLSLNRTPMCNPVLDIMPDLRVFRCFGCTSAGSIQLNPTSTDDRAGVVTTLQDASDLFTAQLDSMKYLVPTQDQCITCKYRIIGKCTGGCLQPKLPKMIQAHRLVQAEFGGITSYANE